MWFIGYHHLLTASKNAPHIVNHWQKRKQGKFIWDYDSWGQKIPEHERNDCCQQNSKKVREDSGISENLLEPSGKVLWNPPLLHCPPSMVVCGLLTPFLSKLTDAPHISLFICRNIAQMWKLTRGKKSWRRYSLFSLLALECVITGN